MKEIEYKKYGTILNLGAGPRIFPKFLHNIPEYLLVNIDKCYDRSDCNLSKIENLHEKIDRQLPFENGEKRTYYLRYDWATFIQEYRRFFDHIVLYRFLEHIPMRSILYFIYMLSTILKVSGYVHCIVPNYKLLAEILLSENPGTINFESENILLTTEMLNEPEDPHCSLWTPQRARYFFELEGRFKIISLNEQILFDGRNIYMEFIARRVK